MVTIILVTRKGTKLWGRGVRITETRKFVSAFREKARYSFRSWIIHLWFMDTSWPMSLFWLFFVRRSVVLHTELDLHNDSNEFSHIWGTPRLGSSSYGLVSPPTWSTVGPAVGPLKWNRNSLPGWIVFLVSDPISSFASHVARSSDISPISEGPTAELWGIPLGFHTYAGDGRSSLHVGADVTTRVRKCVSFPRTKRFFVVMSFVSIFIPRAKRGQLY